MCPEVINADPYMSPETKSMCPEVIKADPNMSSEREHASGNY